jgi:hypothetical protein
MMSNHGIHSVSIDKPSLFIKGKRKTNYVILFFSMSVNIICTCGNLCWQILILQQIKIG